MCYSDSELISKSKKGDSSAFGKLVKRYQNELYNYIYSQVFDNDLAKELFQETCIASWNKISSFKRTDSFYLWLRLTAGEKVDKEFILRAKKGSRDAFGHLVRRYQKRIEEYFLVNQLKFNEEDAKELFQETCFLAWDKISSLKKVSSFHPWLRKIAHNKARERWRKKDKNHEIQVDNWDENINNIPLDTKPWFLNPFLCLVDEFQENCVKRKINLLPDNLREVISLRISGLSYKEIGKECNISLEKVKQRTFRARDKLVNEYKIEECFG